MRTIIAAKELKEILKEHRKWLNGKGGERAILTGADLSYKDLRGVDLRHADLRYVDLINTDLSGADLRGTYLYGPDLEYAYCRPWLVYAGNIDHKRFKTIYYFADYDNVRYGDWNNYRGGTLDEFKLRIDKVYPADSENEEHQRYRLEYLSAIKMFESMREAYLKEAEKEKEQ